MEDMDASRLRQIPLLSDASDAALSELLSQAPSHTHQYACGDLVALQGARIKSLFILLSGVVRAQMTSPEGKRLTIDTIEGPELLASAFVYGSEGRFPVTIEAIKPCTIWHLDKEYFLHFMSRHIPVMRSFLGIISDRSNFLSQKINALSLQSLRERLLSYLKDKGRIGKQEDLALLMGVARPSLARLLGELVEEGILSRDAEGYHLKN